MRVRPLQQRLYIVPPNSTEGNSVIINGGSFSSTSGVTPTEGNFGLRIHPTSTYNKTEVIKISGGTFNGLRVDADDIKIGDLLEDGYTTYNYSTSTIATSIAGLNSTKEHIYVDKLPIVSTVNITLTEPKAGETPNKAISTSTEGVGVSATRVATSADTCRWYHNGSVMTASETFASGETYSARFMLHAKSGYSLSDKPTVYVNEKAADYVTATGTYLTYEISFPLPDKKSVASVALTVTEPKAGEKVNDDVSVSTYNVYTTANGAMNKCIWLDENGNELTTDDTFEGGKTYTVWVIPVKINIFVSEANRSYVTKDTAVKINGTAAEFKGYSEDRCVFELKFTCPSARKPGDVNEDGAVNIKDVMLIQQYIVGWKVSINAANANVNGDSKIDIRDVMLVQQSIVGWNVTLQ